MQSGEGCQFSAISCQVDAFAIRLSGVNAGPITRAKARERACVTAADGVACLATTENAIMVAINESVAGQ